MAERKPKVPVIFRADKGGDFEGVVTAVFPATENPITGYATCYGHVGQHSECSRRWYQGTRPATPEEYAPLLAELTSIYTDEELVVRTRWTR